MSNRTETDARLVESDTSGYEMLATATAGLGILTVVLGFLTLAEIVPFDAGVAGVAMPTVFGGILGLLGVLTVGLGVASAVDAVETTPDYDVGLVTAAAFGLLWAIVAGLFASQTLGFGAVVWVPATVAAGLAVTVVIILPKEDLGSTLPSGVLALLAGGVFLTGVIGTGWEWSPPDFQAAFTAPVTIPVVGIVVSLITAWGAAKAHGGFGRRGRQRAAYMAIWLLAGLVLSVLLYLLVFVTLKGAGRAFAGFGFGPGLQFNWPFVTNGVSLMEDQPGILPAVLGTVWLVIGAMSLAVPLGVGAAVFLTEYAERGRVTQVVEVATNGLWSTPSIVFGLFGYAFLVPRLGNTKSMLSGMLVLGFMLLPLVVITSRESMKSVPDEYRDASAALGVSQWQTIRSVVLPAAMPGVITGIILGVGRIAGETAPLLLVFAGGVFVSGSKAPNVLGSFDVDFVFGPPFLEISNPALFEAGTALPYQLFAIITAGLTGSNIQNPLEFAWATAFLLLLVVLSFYAVGIATRMYFRKKISHE